MFVCLPGLEIYDHGNMDNDMEVEEINEEDRQEI